MSPGPPRLRHGPGRLEGASGALLVSLSLLSGTAACDETSQRRSLVDPAAWRAVAPEADPFGPAPSECTPTSHGVEVFGAEPSYSIATDGCAHLTLVQPALHRATRGEQLHVRVWHFPLSHPEGPAEARLILALGGERVWEAEVPIPSPSQLLSPEPALEADLLDGAPIHFHLENHGMNSWNLLEVSVGGPAGDGAP